MKRVFLSFRAEDKKQVDGLRLLAANPDFDIEFYDESVRTPYNSEQATYIKGKIREKIRRASVTVCLLSSETHTSEWVNWELQESIDAGNKIILMGLPGGPDRLTVPAAVKGQTWYLWNLDSLKKMIDG
jgi:hypothetical protein